MSRTRSRLYGVTGAALVAVLTIAGCSAGSQASGTAPTSNEPTAVTAASAVPSASSRSSIASVASVATPLTSARISPGNSASSQARAVISDPVGDAEPGYLDITGVEARTHPGTLDLSMTLASALPASTVTVGTVRYEIGLDTDGDGVADAVAALENVPEGGFRPVLTDVATGHRFEGADFPGTAGLTGNEVTLSLAVDAVGCPSTVSIAASSMRTRAGATAGDQAPDAGGGELTVTTGC